MKYITSDDVAGRLTWADITHALRDGHTRPAAQIGDQFMSRGDDTLLSRSAWIDGLGFGVKSVSVMPANPARGLASVNGAMLIFDDETGEIEAIVESGLVTRWKTAGDSVFAAQLLARPDSQRLLIVGAGVVAESLVSAYSEIFPGLTQIEIWARRGEQAVDLARRLAAAGYPTTAAPDLERACARADIISTATMARAPVVKGAWITPGTHVDLIGAFTAEMREADDGLLQAGRIFVDSYDTTIGHIGELMMPLANGAIERGDILADFYDLIAARHAGRASADEITVFKNGGGAHLDLMVAKRILAAAEAPPGAA